MQPGDKIEFVEVLNGLAAIKGKELTKEAISLWWAAMAKWSLQDFKGAASHLVGACQFMPSPFDFEQLKKAGEPTPSEAWVIANRACCKWRTPEQLPNGRIARAAAAVGGFQAIAMADTERELPHLARRFISAYEEMSDVDHTRRELPQIANINLDSLLMALPGSVLRLDRHE